MSAELNLQRLIATIHADVHRRDDQQSRDPATLDELTQDAERCRIWVSTLRLLDEQTHQELMLREAQVTPDDFHNYQAHITWKRRSLRHRYAVQQRLIEAEYHLRRRSNLFEAGDALLVAAFRLFTVMLSPAQEILDWTDQYRAWRLLRLGQFGPLNDGEKKLDESSDG